MAVRCAIGISKELSLQVRVLRTEATGLAVKLIDSSVPIPGGGLVRVVIGKGLGVAWLEVVR